MRTIGVVSVGRSDYGMYVPVLRQIQAQADLRLRLFVTGMHLSPEFGLTARDIEADGFAIHERIEMLLSSDTPEAIATSSGRGVMGFAHAYARTRPDLLMVLGDRFEMHAAALAALPFKIPVAHIHGGELTQGAMDDALRHSITKLSHLHFVATEEYRRRVLQMGEEPWRVVVSGSPTLDHLRMISLLGPNELTARYGVRVNPPPLLVTFHPVTLEYERVEWHVGELLAALEACGCPALFTMPNADTNGRVIRRMIHAYVQDHPHAQAVENLGTQGYFSLMACAPAMVGNSSSGIIEAPSFGLPVVNIGTRQDGRIKARNVVDVGYQRDDVLRGITQALEPGFRAALHGLSNPYGDGRAAEMIIHQLKTIELGDRLIRKRFADVPVEQAGGVAALVKEHA